MRNSSLQGLIVVDKPSGLTSHQVVQRVKRMLGLHKAGHTGTLDPFATGVLVIGVNEGTKLAPFLREEQKDYEGVLRLGVETDTQDSTGKILREQSVCCSLEEIVAAFERFRGKIMQTPPMYSALKQEGVPLYRLARAGKEVGRRSREVEIFDIQIIRHEVPRVEFRVVCSKGTYVRTLAHDIGVALGCGACLEQLRRTRSGDFSLAEAVDLSTLESASVEKIVAQWLIPPVRALAPLPEVTVSDLVAEWVRHGRMVTRGEVGAQNIPAEGGVVKILRQDGMLLAIAETQRHRAQDENQVREDVAAWKLLRVFHLKPEA